MSIGVPHSSGSMLSFEMEAFVFNNADAVKSVSSVHWQQLRCRKSLNTVHGKILRIAQYFVKIQSCGRLCIFFSLDSDVIKKKNDLQEWSV